VAAQGRLVLGLALLCSPVRTPSPASLSIAGDDVDRLGRCGGCRFRCRFELPACHEYASGPRLDHEPSPGSQGERCGDSCELLEGPVWPIWTSKLRGEVTDTTSGCASGKRLLRGRKGSPVARDARGFNRGRHNQDDPGSRCVPLGRLRRLVRPRWGRTDALLPRHDSLDVERPRNEQRLMPRPRTHWR
jgi:hypothetical protein